MKIFFVRLEDTSLYIFESLNIDEAIEHLEKVFHEYKFEYDIMELDGELFVKFDETRIYVRPE